MTLNCYLVTVQDKLHRSRSVAYSVEIVLLNKQFNLGCRSLSALLPDRYIPKTLTTRLKHVFVAPSHEIHV